MQQVKDWSAFAAPPADVFWYWSTNPTQEGAQNRRLCSFFYIF